MVHSAQTGLSEIYFFPQEPLPLFNLKHTDMVDTDMVDKS